MDELARLHAWLDGRVQGVGFRMFVLNTATNLGLKGWVRNTYQGEVEVLAEGARSDLDDLLEALRRGPRGAFVNELRTDWGPASGEFHDFKVGYTT